MQSRDDENPQANWPTLTADVIAYRLRMGRERRARMGKRMAAFRRRRKALLASLQAQGNDALPNLPSSPDDEL
jgi:hypothetical protein